MLKDRSILAVPLTGLGAGPRRGVSRSERIENLRLFNAGEAHILVGTSAADEGIDITAHQGFSSNVGSNRRDKQQRDVWGAHPSVDSLIFAHLQRVMVRF